MRKFHFICDTKKEENPLLARGLGFCSGMEDSAKNKLDSLLFHDVNYVHIGNLFLSENRIAKRT